MGNTNISLIMRAGLWETLTKKYFQSMQAVYITYSQWNGAKRFAVNKHLWLINICC